MNGLKYLSYAVPCCMALSGAPDGIPVAFITTMFLVFLLAITDRG